MRSIIGTCIFQTCAGEAKRIHGLYYRLLKPFLSQARASFPDDFFCVCTGLRKLRSVIPLTGFCSILFSYTFFWIGLLTIPNSCQVAYVCPLLLERCHELDQRDCHDLKRPSYLMDWPLWFSLYQECRSTIKANPVSVLESLMILNPYRWMWILQTEWEPVYSTNSSKGGSMWNFTNLSLMDIVSAIPSHHGVIICCSEKVSAKICSPKKSGSSLLKAVLKNSSKSLCRHKGSLFGKQALVWGRSSLKKKNFSCTNSAVDNGA